MLKTFSKKLAVFIIAFFVAILGGLTLSGCMADGRNGENGANGSKWLTGYEVPTMAIGADGDMYLNTQSHILYQKVNGSWIIIMNNFGVGGGSGTDGKDGVDGSTWLTGTDNPTTLQGKAGDFYLNSTTCDVFFKTASGWGEPIVNIKGAAGENGSDGQDGTTPTITVSANGVILINGVETELKKFTVDETLQNSGEAADAKIVGDKLAELEDNINKGKVDIDRLSSYQNTIIYNKTNLITEGFKWSSGYINADNGRTGVNDQYSYTETYIPVDADKTYALFADQQNVRVIHYAFYDESYLYLSGSKTETSLITTPEKAKFLRLSVKTDKLNAEDLQAGMFTMEFYNQNTIIYSEPKAIAKITGLDAGETIIDGSISVDKCDFFDKYDSPNLLKDIHDGYIHDPNGATMIQNQYSGSYMVLSDIPVVPGKIVSVYDDMGTRLNLRMVAMFDGDGAIIKTTQQEGVNINATEFQVPANCAYVSLTIYKTAYEKNNNIQVQCTNDGKYIGKYYEPGVALYKLKDQYFEYAASKNKTIHAYLPSELCVAEGKTIELYNSQICLEHKNYHFQWLANGFGRPYERKFTIIGNPSLTGQTKTLTLNLVDDDLEIVYTATCTVKFVSSKIENQQLIIPIGDSLTNNKAWLNKVYEDSNGQIKFRGTQGTTDKKVDNGVTHEGRSGAGTNWYNLGNSKYSFQPTNTTLEVQAADTSEPYTTNPFWNPTTDTFDFDYYCNSTAEGGAGYFQDAEGNEISINPTGVQIYLGTNGIKLDSADAVMHIRGLISRLQNSVKGKNIPIYVVNTLFRPSQIFAVNSDGYATNSSGEFSFQADMKVMNLEIALYNELKNVNNVFFVPVAATHDSEYNFPYQEVPVNPYQPDITTKEYTDCVHPSTAGYYQMADIIYSTIAAHYKDYITA